MKKLPDFETKKENSCCSDESDCVSSESSYKEKDSSDSSNYRMFFPVIGSLFFLGVGIILDYHFSKWFSGWVRFLWYILAYLPVGFPVLKEAVESVLKGDLFTEFFLMSIATMGAFYLSEYPEGVAVMLFYSVGEIFQTLAVKKAKLNIKHLLDQRPDIVNVIVGSDITEKKAFEVSIGEIIQLKAGEKLALDGILISEVASFNTSALTGESKPDTKREGEAVFAGMINLGNLSNIKVTASFKDSKLSKILELVEEAVNKKAPTEKFIRKFAKIYTPVVVFLAVAICIIPYFLVEEYIFNQWFYRSLIFLVISCPCALVISIPLGYFGGIGAASKNGILIKGSNYLDAMASIQNVVMDKTGTLTEGVFEVQEVKIEPNFEREKILNYVNAIESKSTHPVAMAIRNFVGKINDSLGLKDIEEIPGFGMHANIDNKEILVGNFRLLDKYKINYDVDTANFNSTIIAIAIEQKFVGYISISDKIKEDSAATIQELHKLNVKTLMLSGDKSSVVGFVATRIGIDEFYGDLLPEEKVEKVRLIKSRNESVAFVGDGINDAPVVALSDVGIAMGGLGSDATIETADLVIQDDKPSKIPMAIRIGRTTRGIVWQNICLAFLVKAIVLILGAGGLATMWEAVFADVGVAFLAILNSIRMQMKKF
ncbi:cadmium-translocating P-type ATPase [Leptospira bourretii]|uniref:P-type Zn(2+) transporter n=3 Tax=Leptospira TaxID=171 RepID=A0A2P2DVH0_9LEPT|nr:MULTISPECIES: heavy metal translocating P-type ATPase [Leptospira]MCW7467564.1 cadmium-translocating P-type ATPase [Leptospira levettii]MCW7472191.1 cadmium-translocating P-type ATPase [Leptospira levettii]MCW7513494.1 cadmium-translocating P-type ATPase [Leptospira levettii]MCW7517238.1 cadmium-translocating P-type ATPase [Leptospira levettii]TGK84825.1 cadmium-translocating P-type ATPase [Leptospira bourretii]